MKRSLFLLLFLLAGCVPMPTAAGDVIFLPVIGGPPAMFACGHNLAAQRMSNIFSQADWQQREQMICHPKLVEAAQDKAVDMATRNYFAHISPDGVNANENVERHGYDLPYSPQSNNVESLAVGYPTVETAFAGLLASEKHFPHITASTDFYREQRCYGVGFAYNGYTEWLFYYVVLSAPCNDEE